MSDQVMAIVCPQCGGELPEGVFSELCPSCKQAIVISKCPCCSKEGLMVIRQTRQRVAFHEECGWTKIEQGLDRKVAHEIEEGETLKSCPRCETGNRNGANYCKECGYNSDSVFWRCPQCHAWETIQFRFKL